MFKQFDIDYNKITIDGIEIPKHKNISVIEWTDFWDSSKKAYDDRADIPDWEADLEGCATDISYFEKDVSDLQKIIDDKQNEIHNLDQEVCDLEKAHNDFLVELEEQATNLSKEGLISWIQDQ